jgi:hypothetical protein
MKMKTYKQFENLIKWLKAEKIRYELNVVEDGEYINWDIFIMQGELSPEQNATLTKLFNAVSATRPVRV